MPSRMSETFPEKKVLAEQSQQQWPKVWMPQTAALLVFRNADRGHAGETVFLRRPPTSLRDLLLACSRACRPIVGPAEALLTPELVPVRSLGGLDANGVYLLKGMEPLDPPQLFFKHQEFAGAASLGQLDKTKSTVAVVHEALRSPSRPITPAQSLSQTSSAPALMTPSLLQGPLSGSPPWLSQASLESAPRGRKWQASSTVSMALSWGGLGQPGCHHDWNTWPRSLECSSHRFTERPQTR